MHTRRGFTILEIVIVIVIIGILMAIAMPKLVGLVTSAQQASEDATVATIQEGIRLHASQNVINS